MCEEDFLLILLPEKARNECCEDSTKTSLNVPSLRSVVNKTLHAFEPTSFVFTNAAHMRMKIFNNVYAHAHHSRWRVE